MKNCPKLEHDVTRQNYHTKNSGISCPGNRLRTWDDLHFRLGTSSAGCDILRDLYYCTYIYLIKACDYLIQLALVIIWVHIYTYSNSCSFISYIFSENVSHDFKLDMEIYYSVSSDNAANRASGLMRPLRRTPSGHEVPKFILAGHTQLTVDHLHEDIKSHDLKTGKMAKRLLNVKLNCILFKWYSLKKIKYQIN